jgi:hypothetical protein
LEEQEDINSPDTFSEAKRKCDEQMEELFEAMREGDLTQSQQEEVI